MPVTFPRPTQTRAHLNTPLLLQEGGKSQMAISFQPITNCVTSGKSHTICVPSLSIKQGLK